MFNKLSAPFPADAIHWRAQTLTGDGTKALALAYLDARDVMDRLDAVCGTAGWQSSITETPSGRVLCRLEINHEGQWIAKTDGAGSTAVEGEKGGISDALKRAAVLWGVGRYLYDLGNVWAPCETYERNSKKHWKAWKPEAQQIFAAALAKLSRPTGPINDATRDWISSKIDARQIPPGELCKAFEVTSLKALTYEQLEDVKAWIRDHRKEAA